jgi:hypothetical protein
VAFYPSGEKGMGGAVNSNISPLFRKYCILFRYPRDFARKIPTLYSIFRTLPGPWSEFSFVRSFKVRSSVFHCISEVTTPGNIKVHSRKTYIMLQPIFFVYFDYFTE